MKGVSINVQDEQKSNLWIIQIAATGVTYTIDMDTKQCQKTTIPTQQIYCIPGIYLFILFFDENFFLFKNQQLIYIHQIMDMVINK
mgnify:CR=1 FL=1